MKSGTKTKILAAFILAATATTALAQHQSSHFCSIDTVKIKKNHLRTALVTQGINLGLWTYDRHISGSEFAKINIKTVRSNMETGFVWDSDRLATNHLGHPLNGGFYHSAARANGLTYWEALPYSVAGSLVWEVFAEKEPPGLNDFIATPLAGAAFGEVSHRISGLILDNSRPFPFPYRWRYRPAYAMWPTAGFSPVAEPPPTFALGWNMVIKPMLPGTRPLIISGWALQ